jgi:uncharacterized protein YndB with AHSA1/START domain
MAGRSSRWWLTEDSTEVVVDAPPERIYDLVADLPRMGEWSPECQRVEWENGSREPEVGATFVGHNRGGPRGLMKWSRRGRVLVADRGREFAFVTEEGGRESTVWRYRFDARDAATTVTESYEVKRIPVWARIVDVPTNRARELVDGMEHSLARLKAAAESSDAAGQRSGGAEGAAQ